MAGAGASVRRGVAERWERVESAGARVLLLGVFLFGLVAQFVKPIGDALEGKVYLGGALLSLIGYLLYAQVLRLASAHSAQLELTRELRAEVRDLQSRTEQEFGQPVSVDELSGVFREALTQREATLSALAFTGEVFVEKLRPLLDTLPEDARRRITVQVLVPDFDKPIQLPGQVREGKAQDSPSFRARLASRIAGNQRELIRVAEDVRGGTVTVEFRALHMSPFLKLYLVNSDQICEGVYDRFKFGGVGNAERAREGGLLDLLGYESKLTLWRSGDGARARQLVDARNAYFEQLWSVATPLTVPGPGDEPGA
ncbi:ATP/GTP-binding protein [Streptomyces sp. NPDC102381]|uniref:ATP/GTP-binding protein n=1 Tax=Streptomyces sp. NPDC102381 TaxID=3366164 RepID=UPI0037F40AFD